MRCPEWRRGRTFAGRYLFVEGGDGLRGLGGDLGGHRFAPDEIVQEADAENQDADADDVADNAEGDEIQEEQADAADQGGQDDGEHVFAAADGVGFGSMAFLENAASLDCGADGYIVECNRRAAQG